MEVKKYEIGMLDVKVADAFLIHFFDENLSPRFKKRRNSVNDL